MGNCKSASTSNFNSSASTSASTSDYKCHYKGSNYNNYVNEHRKNVCFLKEIATYYHNYPASYYYPPSEAVIKQSQKALEEINKLLHPILSFRSDLIPDAELDFLKSFVDKVVEITSPVKSAFMKEQFDRYIQDHPMIASEGWRTLEEYYYERTKEDG